MTYGAQITPTAGTAAGTDHHVLHAAIAMGPHVRAAANEIERERRLPQSVVSEMRLAGIFGMAMPRAWGGPEVDPLTQLRTIEALAMADGSVGWCSMINCDGGYVTAFLDQEVARMMYSDIDVATAAPVSPTGQAVRVPGGFRVSGRFPFASGSLHCDWAWVGCVVVENGKPRINDNGVPETRQCLLEMSRCKIEDTWYTTGLRGTGSNDLFVTDQFVEEARSFSLQDPALVKRRGALYAYPFMFAAKGAAPALGIARHALDALIDRASSTSTRRYVVGNGIEPVKLMRDDVCVQEAVARADTMLMAARSHYFQCDG
jgi:alkylation response protein AidB-like acyl-CoA dehydrogenase